MSNFYQNTWNYRQLILSHTTKTSIIWFVLVSVCFNFILSYSNISVCFLQKIFILVHPNAASIRPHVKKLLAPPLWSIVYVRFEVHVRQMMFKYVRCEFKYVRCTEWKIDGIWWFRGWGHMRKILFTYVNWRNCYDQRTWRKMSRTCAGEISGHLRKLKKV